MIAPPASLIVPKSAGDAATSAPTPSNDADMATTSPKTVPGTIQAARLRPSDTPYDTANRFTGPGTDTSPKLARAKANQTCPSISQPAGAASARSLVEPRDDIDTFDVMKQGRAVIERLETDPVEQAVI